MMKIITVPQIAFLASQAINHGIATAGEFIAWLALRNIAVSVDALKEIYRVYGETEVERHE